MATKLTAEQRVTKAHVWLMNSPKYCLYSGVFMIGETKVVDDKGFTAATNGRDTRYGREFVDKLDDKCLRGLILHENLHKALRQLSVWEHLFKKEAQIANVATDFVVNLMIHDSDPQGADVALPKGGCFDEKFRGMDTGSVFRALQQQQQSGGKGKGSGDGEGFDEHEVGGGGDDEDGDENGNGKGKPRKLSQKEVEELSQQIDQALRQGAMLAGRMKGNVAREITDLLTPKIDWREALREFVTSFCAERDFSSWRRVNKRWVGSDVYMPSSMGESVGRLIVAIDMSGSIGANEVGQFLGEVKSICETVAPEGIDLLYWDTDVCQHEKYERDQLSGLMQSTKPRGGGGTSPSCITEYINQKKIKAECCVVLTDGYVGNDWGGTWPCPVLWAITSDVVSPVGKSVRMGVE